MNVQPPLLKDPDEILTLSVDWAEVLATGESIAVSPPPAWIIEGVSASDPSPLALEGSAQTSGTIASQQIRAGSLHQVYTVVCRMQTNTGQSYDRSWTIRIGAR